MKKKYTYLIVIFLIVASCAAFGRIAGNDFKASLDDRIYITENDYVKSGINTESIKWAFTTTYFGYWHPLNLISHMLDWNLFGANPSGHHLVGLFLHIGAVIFLFLFLNKTTNNIWSSAFAAALFALHPLRVESVAYAGERKDVLSMFFGMASIYFYAFYAESSKLSRYFLCLILFALALMSKPTLVTLPFLLMLLDYWPLKRWQKATVEPDFNSKGKLILEKVPFIFLAVAISIVTLWVHYRGGSFVQSDYLLFLKRIANAIVSYAAYLGKTFWPVNLAVFYPYDPSLPLWKILISGISLILITLAVFYYIKIMPFLFAGWFWYLGTLIPVIGFIKLGELAMADRYTYLPSIGIAIMLAWGIPSLIKSEEYRKKILFPAAIFVLAILLVLTWRQCGYWKNDTVLWSHTLEATKDNALSRNNLGLALFAEGETEEAINHYNRAIRISPTAVPLYYNRGNAYAKLGQYKLAIEDFNNTIRLTSTYYMVSKNQKPDYSVVYNDRGIIYGKLNQYQNAIDDFNKGIDLNPNFFKAYNNRGFAYSKLGQYQHAIEDYSKAIKLQPDYAKAYINRAIVYLSQGEKGLGCYDAQKACELGNCIELENAKTKGLCP